MLGAEYSKSTFKMKCVFAIHHLVLSSYLLLQYKSIYIYAHTIADKNIKEKALCIKINDGKETRQSKTNLLIKDPSLACLALYNI